MNEMSVEASEVLNKLSKRIGDLSIECASLSAYCDVLSEMNKELEIRLKETEDSVHVRE